MPWMASVYSNIHSLGHVECITGIGYESLSSLQQSMANTLQWRTKGTNAYISEMLQTQQHNLLGAQRTLIWIHI